MRPQSVNFGVLRGEPGLHLGILCGEPGLHLGVLSSELGVNVFPQKVDLGVLRGKSGVNVRPQSVKLGVLRGKSGLHLGILGNKPGLHSFVLRGESGINVRSQGVNPGIRRIRLDFQRRNALLDLDDIDVHFIHLLGERGVVSPHLLPGGARIGPDVEDGPDDGKHEHRRGYPKLNLFHSRFPPAIRSAGAQPQLRQTRRPVARHRQPGRRAGIILPL